MDSKPNAQDVALCFEGGGMRASYTGAIASALDRAGLGFPYVCGISAGASLTLDYLSHDPARNRAVFVDGALDPSFGGPAHFIQGHGYFNADYLYEGCVELGTCPFDYEAYLAAPEAFCIQSFDGETGETLRWHREDVFGVVDLMSRARASSTLPTMMKPIHVDGHLCYDGGLGEGAGLPHVMAQADGYDRFVVVLTRPGGYRKKPLDREQVTAVTKAFRRHPALGEAIATRAERYNAALDDLEELEREGRALIVRPEAMPVDNSTLQWERLDRSWKLGEAQGAREVDRIRRWLEDA